MHGDNLQVNSYLMNFNAVVEQNIKLSGRRLFSRGMTVSAGDISHAKWWVVVSVIFVNENENENSEKRENNEFVNEN